MTMTNGNGQDIRERARADALAGMSRADIAAKYEMSDGWAGIVIRESGRTKVRSVATGAVPVAVVDGVREAPSPARTKTAVARGKARRGSPPLPLMVLTVVAGLMVLVVTAVVSYTHVRHLAEIAGQADLAVWYPLGVDGLVAVCSGVLLWDRHAGRPVSWVARIGAGLGLVATFVANGMAYDPDLASVYVAGLILAVYPPVALAVVWHLLNRMLVER